MRKHYSDRINSANNVQRAWKVIDSLMAKDNQNRHDNISLVIQGGLCTGPREVAENSNNYYLGVPEEVCKNLEDAQNIKKVQNSMFLTPSTADDIREIIAKMKNKKLCWIDDI